MCALIDFSAPVGLLMVAVLHFVANEADPFGVVATLAAALAPGSYLVISHATHESAPEVVAKIVDLYSQNASTAAYAPSHEEISRFFDGVDLIPPGLVYLPLWRPDGRAPSNPDRAWFYAGVGRKPG